jgi:hypothetical protein
MSSKDAYTLLLCVYKRRWRKGNGIPVKRRHRSCLQYGDYELTREKIGNRIGVENGE